MSEFESMVTEIGEVVERYMDRGGRSNLFACYRFGDLVVVTMDPVVGFFRNETEKSEPTVDGEAIHGPNV